MNEGIYEELVTELVKRKLNEIDKDTFYIKETAVDKAEASSIFSNHLSKVFKYAFSIIKSENIIDTQIEIEEFEEFMNGPGYEQNSLGDKNIIQQQEGVTFREALTIAETILNQSGTSVRHDNRKSITLFGRERTISGGSKSVPPGRRGRPTTES